MPSNEAGVVSVAHPFLEDSFSKVFTEAIAGADQIVVPTVGLRKSTQDSPGDQPAIRQHGQHSLQKKKSLFWTHTRSPSSLVAGHCSLYVLCFRFCYPSICYQILEKKMSNQQQTKSARTATDRRWLFCSFHASGVSFKNAVPPLGSLLADMFPQKDEHIRVFLTFHNRDVISRRWGVGRRLVFILTTETLN